MPRASPACPNAPPAGVLSDAVAADLLASDTPKDPVLLRFPQDTLETLFPYLYPQA